jgi:hypothetical protein
MLSDEFYNRSNIQDYFRWIKCGRLAVPEGIVAPYFYVNKSYGHTHCGHLEDEPNLEQSSLNVADLGPEDMLGPIRSPPSRQPKWGTALKSTRGKEQKRMQKQGAETGCRNRVQKQGAETKCRNKVQGLEGHNV